jgi:hypothetical protein
MSTFRLGPTQEGIDDKNWVASTYKGVCHVGAKDEKEARQLAAMAFGVGTSRTGGKIPVCPWKQPHLTECVEVHSIGAPVPLGMITTPDEPEPFSPDQA